MKKFKVILYWDVFGKCEIVHEEITLAHNRYEAEANVTWGKGYLYTHYHVEEIK